MNPLRKEKTSRKERKTPADVVADRKPSGPQLLVKERAGQPADMCSEQGMPLFSDNELRDLCFRWEKIQTGLVDDPRQAVQQAGSLVAAAIKRLAEQFADERSQLEKQWDQGDNVATEDLRLTLQKYRAFFDRLLSVSRVTKDSITVKRDVVGHQMVGEVAFDADEVAADGEQHLLHENGGGFA